ncbi:MAG: imidazole glycerol phosphate synthase subunit HisH [Candidatus Hydrogenedentota bacterium]
MKKLDSPLIVVVDYGMGNLRSVAKSIEAVGGSVIVSNKREEIKNADKIVLPGVGAFAEGMNNLNKLGVIETLYEEVKLKKKPFLGICLGMQLLATESYEHGIYKGLNWISGKVKLLGADGIKVKIPHIGWDDVKIIKKHKIFNTFSENTIFYFVHSYYFECDDKEFVIATCNYGIEFPAAICRDTIMATQFHPEKSQSSGLKLLRNFINA